MISALYCDGDDTWVAHYTPETHTAKNTMSSIENGIRVLG